MFTVGRHVEWLIYNACCVDAAGVKLLAFYRITYLIS